MRPQSTAGLRDDVVAVEPVDLERSRPAGAFRRRAAASLPGGSTSCAFTMSRSAAEYFGLHVVRVSVARLVPGFAGSGSGASTSPASGLTANGSCAPCR